MEPIAIERSIWINVPPERVWPAVTQADHLTQWYATLYAWEIPSLAVGATLRFFNSADEGLAATIEILDAPREFTVRWHEAPGSPSLVTSFLLVPENGGTRFTIRESGYEQVPADERQQWMDASGGGYSVSVENLKALAEALPAA